ncbi:chymotrypsin-2 [Copidosoma floridanum]|uniref:chymotrypsin-2 n=1 Tax=Copidosoma floridanum TaxID=29053 RepID=UPI0006C95E3A|nr:chymotrypsin-2 [Copidosoma floridanum]
MKSFTTTIVAALLAMAYGEVEINVMSSRIVGGNIAEIGAFPHQVSLRRLNGRHFCGGSIINDQWIVTAAHCLQKMGDRDITVITGTNRLSEGGVAYRSEKVIPHQKFSMMFFVRNDIGLIKVNRTIEFDEVTKPIPLPTTNIKENNYPAVVSGWGLVKGGGTSADLPDELQYLNTFLLSRWACSKKTLFPMFSSSKICAFTKQNQGVCNGDSGGPLMADGNLVGVVSYGIMGCALGLPDFYTRVYSYLDWIEKTTSSS